MSARALPRALPFPISAIGFAWAVLRPVLGLLARTPLTTTTLALITAGYLWAGYNALYLQNEPARIASLSSPQAQAAMERALAAVPALVERQATVSVPQIDPVETRSVGANAPAVTVPGEVVGNADAFRVQSMLKALGFFAADIDGYYGPVTAESIRSFEVGAGLTPTGAITAELIGALEASYARGSVRQSLSRAPALPAEPIPEPLTRPASADPLAEIALSASRDTPDPVPALSATAPRAQIAAAPATTAPAAAPAATDRDLVLAVQRGLASLGFLHGPIDGISGEATARAVRNFEVFNNYRVTGEVTPELLDMLQAANATF